MAYEFPGAGALDYYPCRYGKSKLLFRGPKRRLDAPYCVALGGTETYGKFVASPYPALLETMLGMPIVNLGYNNAGVDVFVNEPTVIEACAAAKLTVVQLVGAQNTSNRFYAVHPRRNDRFLRASNLMKTLFQEVDFTEFHFTRHMLSELKLRTPEKFALIEAELKEAWIARMKQLLEKIGRNTVLLWLADYHPSGRREDSLGPDPLFLDESMLARVRDLAAAVVRIDPSAEARNDGVAGMEFAPLDEPAAAELPGPRIHQEIAAALAGTVRRFL